MQLNTSATQVSTNEKDSNEKDSNERDSNEQLDTSVETLIQEGKLHEYNGFYYSPYKQVKLQNKSLFQDTSAIQLLKLVSKFYLKPEHILKLLSIRTRPRIKQKNSPSAVDTVEKPSLRLIDFFFTNYSKRAVVLVKKANIMQMYAQLLKKFTKHKFDMFCRRRYLLFRHPKTDQWTFTSIAQLNFFRFYLSYNVHPFIIKSTRLLRHEMSLALRKNRLKRKKQALTLAYKGKDKKVKRSRLTQSTNYTGYLI